MQNIRINVDMRQYLNSGNRTPKIKQAILASFQHVALCHNTEQPRVMAHSKLMYSKPCYAR